jgi:hypothetical protein
MWFSELLNELQPAMAPQPVTAMTASSASAPIFMRGLVLSVPVMSVPVMSVPVMSVPVMSVPVMSVPVMSVPVLSVPGHMWDATTAPADYQRMPRHRSISDRS